MNIVSQVISLLNRPFPFTEGWRKQTIVAVGVALFVTFFLYVFEPFGLMYVKENKFLICLGFGLVTLISSLIVGLICVKILRIYKKVEGRKIADILITNIRYIESYQNYVKIGYIDRESVINEEVQRATLKSLQEELQATVIVKCHRSYLVNKTSIISVSGNAQGLLLTLQGCDKSIPVSRSFVPAFR